MSILERTRTSHVPLDAPPEEPAERRPEGRDPHRRRLLVLTAVCVVLALVLVIALVVVVDRMATRSQAMGEFEQTASAFTRLSDDTPVADIEASVAGVRAALAVPTDLASAEATTALAAAAADAEPALAAVREAAAWTPDAAVDGTGADDLERAADTVAARAEALRAAEEAAVDQAAALDAARATYSEQVVAGGLAVLGDYADAERATEDAFYAALTGLSTVPVADFGVALADVQAKAEAVRSSAEQYRAEIIAAATGRQPTGGDVAAQTAYLLEYAIDYNLAEWGNYNPSGGDCVNFTSQGLLARGWQMDGTWSSSGPGGASTAWILTPALERYMKAAGFVSHGVEDLDRVRVGDVGIFNWGETSFAADHTMTVSKVEYTVDGPVVYFASHNSDGQYRELKKALYEEHTDSIVRIYSIP